MNHSAINFVIYNIGLKAEMFVIGGRFAAGLCEPVLARSMGNGGEHVELFISSSNFEVLKDFKSDRSTFTTQVTDDKIVISNSRMWITFHRGVPVSWTNKSGYQVQHPTPLKHWLIKNGCESWANLMQDVPFEKRMEGWELTEAEKAFQKACAVNDWYTDYSDDQSVRSRGKAAYTALVKTRDELGGHAKDIFEFYATR